MLNVKTKEQALELLAKAYYDVKDSELLSCYRQLPLKFKEDREICKQLVKYETKLLRYIPQCYQQDRQFYLEIVKEHRSFFQDIQNIYGDDKEFLEAAITNNGLFLSYAKNTDLIKNKEVVLKAVREHGEALQFADDSLKNDLDVINTAMKRHSTAFAYIGKEILQKDSGKIFLSNAFKIMQESSILKSLNFNGMNQLKMNLRNIDNPKISFKLEEMFLKDFNWKDFLKQLDRHDKNLKAISNEIYFYFSLMLPHWKKETIIKLKDELLNEDNKFSHPEIFSDINNFLDEELHKRKVNKKIQNTSLDKAIKSNKKRKLGI
jgi:hypothetical protein